MRSALLVIDVGNTSATFGLFSVSAPRPPVKRWAIPTPQLSSRSFSSELKKKLNGFSLLGVCVCSVVPGIDRVLRRSLRSLVFPKILFVTPATPARVKNLYRKPSEVGADRLVNARAAMELYRGASIVVDFGTATTFDCVAAGGRYLGGVIAPGPVISAEALFRRTAKLPYVVLEKPARILGQNTVESIQSGLYHGYRGLVQEIVRRLKKRMGPRTRVIATGGQARWILKGLPLVPHYEPDLTLIGLVYYWKDQLISRRFDHTLGV